MNLEELNKQYGSLKKAMEKLNERIEKTNKQINSLNAARAVQVSLVVQAKTDRRYKCSKSGRR